MSLSVAQAQVLDTWNDSRAYKPVPVLFLHGFANGRPADWQDVINVLKPYFASYQQIGPYLETLDFQDPNGSIDTYPPGRFNPQGNNRGWSDKLALKIEEMLSSSNYGFYCGQVNIAAHSMGGLAARYYLAVHSSADVPKLILAGVPNLGTPLSSVAKGLSLMQELGWGLFLGPSVYIVPLNYSALETAFLNFLKIDFQGYAIDDMDNSSLGSGFLRYLNRIPQPYKTKHALIIGKKGSILNLMLFQEWEGGDSIVSLRSQTGVVDISADNVFVINAEHWKEPQKIAIENENPVLKFLDSDVPVLEFNDPAQSEVETSEGTIEISGKLFNEYLPADTKLVVSIDNTGSGETYPRQEFPMLPSTLWQPKQPGSPVAEFKAQVILPGQGEFELHIIAVNPAGLSSDDLCLTVKTSSPGPVIELWQPQGMTSSFQPLLYGRARAQEEADLDLSSLSIDLDGVLQTVSKAFISDNSRSAEAYCTPQPDLETGAHNVVFTACDTNGRCASKEWVFTVIDLTAPEGPDGLEPPAGGYVWKQVGTVVSRTYLCRWYPPLRFWDVTPDNFAQKLVEVKDSGLAAVPEEYGDGNVMGLYILWQGTTLSTSADPNVVLDGCMSMQQVAHTLYINEDSIPVYTSVIFDCSHQNAYSSYIKDLTVEADDKFSMSMDKKLQTALFRRPDPSYPSHSISPVLPYYGPRVLLRYSFDPSQYALSDNPNPQIWPREFRIEDRTRFNLYVSVYGWQKQ